MAIDDLFDEETAGTFLTASPEWNAVAGRSTGLSFVYADGSDTNIRVENGGNELDWAARSTGPIGTNQRAEIHIGFGNTIGTIPKTGAFIRLTDINNYVAVYVDHTNKQLSLIERIAGVSTVRGTIPYVAGLTGTAARFVRYNTITQGNWTGVYGADGYQIANSYILSPSYATVTLTGATENPFPGTFNPSDVRALTTPSLSTRVGKGLSSGFNTPIVVDIAPTDGLAHQVEFYFLDWENLGYSNIITVTDAVTNAVLDNRQISDFSAGLWVAYEYRGHVKFSISGAVGIQGLIHGRSAVCAGYFFNNADDGVGIRVEAFGRRCRVWYEMYDRIITDRPPDLAVDLSVDPVVGSWGMFIEDNASNAMRIKRFLADDLPSAVSPPPFLRIEDASGMNFTPILITAATPGVFADVIEWEVSPVDSTDFPEKFIERTAANVTSLTVWVRKGHTYDIRARQRYGDGSFDGWGEYQRITATGTQASVSGPSLPTAAYPNIPADYIMVGTQESSAKAQITDTGRDKVFSSWSRPRRSWKLGYTNRDDATVQSLIDFYDSMAGRNLPFTWTHPTSGETFAVRFDMDERSLNSTSRGDTGLIANIDFDIIEVGYSVVLTMPVSVTLDTSLFKPAPAGGWPQPTPPATATPVCPIDTCAGAYRFSIVALSGSIKSGCFNPLGTTGIGTYSSNADGGGHCGFVNTSVVPPGYTGRGCTFSINVAVVSGAWVCSVTVNPFAGSGSSPSQATACPDGTYIVTLGGGLGTITVSVT